MAHDAFSVARYQQGPQGATSPWGGGLAILNAMKPLFDRAVNKGSITILLETSAVDLIQSRNRAINGVVTKNKDGNPSWQASVSKIASRKSPKEK